MAKKGLIPTNLCSISHFRNTISHNLVSVSHLKIIFGHFGLGWNFIKNKEYAEKQAIMTILWGKVFLRMPFGPYKSRVSEQRNCLIILNRRHYSLFKAISLVRKKADKFLCLAENLTGRLSEAFSDLICIQNCTNSLR